jgi:Mrp family chromosome partitioning ATPase
VADRPGKRSSGGAPGDLPAERTEIMSAKRVRELPVEAPTVTVAQFEPPGDLDARLVMLRDPDSPRAASFRVLRHRLERAGNPGIIAVTSPDAGDGKTTAAANLALALCECGRARVLLAEANFRGAAVSPLFNMRPPSDFAMQVERHKSHPHDAWTVVEVRPSGLHVAAVDPAPEKRKPLVDGPALSFAISTLKRAGYDYVVLDTPPVLGSADVNLVEDVADGVLLVTRSGKSSARALRKAIEQLEPTRLLGVVLLDS